MNVTPAVGGSQINADFEKLAHEIAADKTAASGDQYAQMDSPVV